MALQERAVHAYTVVRRPAVPGAALAVLAHVAPEGALVRLEPAQVEPGELLEPAHRLRVDLAGLLHDGVVLFARRPEAREQVEVAREERGALGTPQVLG